MKAALISFHNAYNYGACLQAYALQEAVRELAVDCEYIDYMNAERTARYSMSARLRRDLKKKNLKGAVKDVLGTPFILIRRRQFDRFYKKYLHKTPETFHSAAELAGLENRYDKFISGSDQIWNAEHNGQDAAFMLGFVHDRHKKVSYASSFGMDTIPSELRSWYAEHLKGIGYLSTREQAGVNIIQNLLGRHAHLVLDPVFLLDASVWRRLIPNTKIGEHYTFYYLNAPFNLSDIERVTGYQDQSRRILSTSVKPQDFIKRGQKITVSMGPEEFLQSIDQADLVVTTSFHCLAFALLFHKKFVAILSGDAGRDERLLNLIKITGLEKRIFTPQMTKEDVDQPIDYLEVEKRLDAFRNYSANYLKAALYEGENEADSLAEPVIPENREDLYTICPTQNCFGCGACSQICPVKAITMQTDQEGFLRPTVNHTACILCHQCRKVCPANHQKTAVEGQRCYAAKNTRDIRAKSSSGGAFRCLASEMIQRGGVVVASEMNKDWKLRHTVARTMEEVERQGRTYYVQSEVYPRFREIRDMLKEGTPVLFVGTPCQVRGLTLFLGKDDPNLLTVDLLCHGVPSPGMFQAFIEYLQSRGNVTALSHRDKSIGWKGYCVSAEIGGKVYRNNGWLKAYNVMFSHGLINRPSCYHCPYTNYDRPSDLTIGDYWGIEKKHKVFFDKMGVSLIFANTAKGQEFLSAAGTQMELLEIQKSDCVQNSLRKPQAQPALRLACMEEMRVSYVQAARKYGEWNAYGFVKEKIRRVTLRLKGY